jgi:4-hydroxybenzoate polyprenyltransferase
MNLESLTVLFRAVARKTVLLARMVKIEHSIFALPFAYIGAFIAAAGWPGWRPFLFLTLAMVAVRSFAMGFNRLADLKFDRENPRTLQRPLVTGELSVRETVLFLLVTGAVFVLACWGMNRMCLLLSLPTLGYCALYSYVKRFSWLCHFALGTVLGLAPVAGWFSVQPALPIPVIALFFGVTFWVAGFDILYACQDVLFDRAKGLHSVPARFGIGPALLLSTFCHVNTGLFFLVAGLSAWLGKAYYLTWLLVCGALVWEHALIKEHDLSRVNLAFFTLNGAISIALFVGVLLAL